MNPTVLAWLVAGLMHFAVDSATVAMVSAAGMVLASLVALELTWLLSQLVWTLTDHKLTS